MRKTVKKKKKDGYYIILTDAVECDRVGGWGRRGGQKNRAKGLKGKLKVLMREGERDRWRGKSL